MNNKFDRLTFEEVISLAIAMGAFKIGEQSFPQTFKVKELAGAFKNQLLNGSIKQLFEEGGVGVEVLKLDAKGWRKGRIRFSLEFCPDKPEIEEINQINNVENNQTSSPLDDIRQMMNKDN